MKKIITLILLILSFKSYSQQGTLSPKKDVNPIINVVPKKNSNPKTNTTKKSTTLNDKSNKTTINF